MVTGKSSEVVGRRTATLNLASDYDVKSEAAASDMTSYSLRIVMGKSAEVVGSWVEWK